MTRYNTRAQLLAACLSAMAGYVDAIGFIGTGGFFVSFMSGNTTRLAVGMTGNAPYIALVAGLIGMFVLGAMAGSLIGRAAGTHRRCAVLGMVALVLAICAALASWNPGGALFGLIAFAMGAENAVFEAEGEVHIGLTYMTGTLVKFAQRLAMALLGGDRWSWVPYLLLWLGLVGGAVAGALIYPVLGLGALWIASTVAAALGFFAWCIGPDVVIAPG